MASDEDLKLSDMLRYYDRNCQAALVSTNLSCYLRITLCVMISI